MEIHSHDPKVRVECLFRYSLTRRCCDDYIRTSMVIELLEYRLQRVFYHLSRDRIDGCITYELIEAFFRYTAYSDTAVDIDPGWSERDLGDDLHAICRIDIITAILDH